MVDRSIFSFVVVFAVVATSISCGKSGPPLPPLVRIPSPPADLLAERRAAAVDLQFTVPNTNTDGSRPANIDRVDVYAITTAAAMTDEDIARHGTRVTTVDVKAPRDPDRTVEPDESESDVDAPQGTGLDQGTMARVSEALTSTALTPADPIRSSKQVKRSGRRGEESQPLLGSASAPLSRAYVAVGVSTRGRKGPASKRAAVPLVPAPPAPGRPTIEYHETAVTVTWAPVTLSGMVQERDTGGVLPSTPIGIPVPTVAYHVYDVSAPEPAAAGIRLTRAPVAETTFDDSRMTWGERRCYTVRAVETIETLALEGEAAAPRCTTLTDTFPPAAPNGLQAVAGEGSISLIWDPNGEKDLAGYLVFRGSGDPDSLVQITLAPLEQASFNDRVAPGIRYVYAVKAVDKAGNISTLSAPAEAMAR